MHRFPRRRFCYLLAGTVAAGGAAAWFGRERNGVLSGNSAPRTFHQVGFALGSPVSLTVLHGDEELANQAMAAAFAELDLIEDVMSLYRPHSQLCQLNQRGQLTGLHPYLYEVLVTAREISQQTQGAFDVTVQPLWELHVTAKRTDSSPSPAEIDAARRLIDWKKLDFDRHSAHLREQGMAVTLNGIAQGFATDRVAAVLRSHGIEHALIDAGELEAVGSKPDGEGWRVGIQHPRATDRLLSLASLKGRCLATSGDYATTFSNDFELNHIFDPRTGLSPNELCSVSIMADTAILADALSTAVFVLGPAAGLELVRRMPGVEALLVTKDGHSLITPEFPVAV